MLMMVILFVIGLVGCNSNESKKDNNESNIDEKDNNIVKINKEDKDIKNILSIISESKEDEVTLIIDNKIRGVQNETGSFYLCKIMDEDYSILCAYIDESEYEYERFRTYEYYSKAKWYKYEKNDLIMENIDKLKLTGLFIVYNAVITQDVVNGEPYNLNCKYYSKIEERIGESYNIPLESNFKLEYNDLLLWEDKDIINNSDYFITDRVFDLGYEVRTNFNGEHRVIFDKVTTVSNGVVQNWIQKQFGESYQYLYEYFENEEDFERIVYSSDYYELYDKVSINLERFIRMVKDNSTNEESISQISNTLDLENEELKNLF